MAISPKVTIVIPQAELDKLKKIAEEEDRPVSNLVTRIIREYLKSREPVT